MISAIYYIGSSVAMDKMYDYKQLVTRPYDIKFAAYLFCYFAAYFSHEGAYI